MIWLREENARVVKIGSGNGGHRERRRGGCKSKRAANAIRVP